MKINKKKIFSALILGFFVLVLAKNALAAQGNLWDSQVGMTEVGQKYGEDSQSPTNVKSIVIRIINYSLSLLGIIFLVLFIMSGYQWMTAGGNEDQISTAKKRMGNAVIGLVIILTAWAVTNFLIVKMLLPATTGNYYYYPS